MILVTIALYLYGAAQTLSGHWFIVYGTTHRRTIDTCTDALYTYACALFKASNTFAVKLAQILVIIQTSSENPCPHYLTTCYVSLRAPNC